MKGILIFFVSASWSLAFAQNPSFEKSFQPHYNSGLNSIVHDTSGYFYAVGSSYNAIDYSAPGVLIKLDHSGNFLFEKYFYFNEETYFNEILIAPDGSLIVCGVASGCDFGERAGIISKISINGDTLWATSINPQEIGTPVDNNLKKIVLLHNDNLLFAADTSIYFCSNVGDSLFTVAVSSHIISIIEGLNENIICGNQFGLHILDSAGQQINSLPFSFPVSDIKLLPDSTYLINSGNTLIKIDSLYNQIAQINLTPINYVADHVVVESGKIYISNALGSDFATFDLNLQLIDSFRTQTSDVIANSFSVADTVIMVAGFELGARNYSYLKSYSTSGAYTYYPIDLALIDVGFDTTFLDQPSPLPQGVYRLNFVARLTVQNTGTDTIHSFYVNAQSMLSGFCGPYIYRILVDSLNLAQGQTISIPLDTLSEFGISIPQFPITYSFCPWISCPDFKVDKDHSNDILCDSLIVESPISVNEILNLQSLNIFPNPFESEITLQFSDSENENYEFIIFDSFGKEKMSGRFNNKNNSINLSGFPSGIYFIKVLTKRKMFTEKIVKL